MTEARMRMQTACGNYIRIEMEGGEYHINADAIVSYGVGERGGEKRVRIRTTDPRGDIPLQGSAAEQFLAAIEAEEE